jgi:flagella basal body P-ring formation protein FlgA
MKWILIVTLVTAAAPGACIRISSAKVVAGDLFEVLPLLRQLDRNAPLGFAPIPGMQRVITGRELSLLANRLGTTLAEIPADVCIERALFSIAPEPMRAALQAALGMPDAEIELIEFTSQPLPQGRLEFQRSSLVQPSSRAPDTPAIWRGKLIYDQARTVPVWARVRITLKRAVYLAEEDIPAGAVVHDRQIKEATLRAFPSSRAPFDSRAEIAGKVAKRAILAGQEFTAGAIEEAKAVVRGDIVQVRVSDGSATLDFDGVAATSGKLGDGILVHNPASGRNFRAIVEEKGKVVVRSSLGK